MAGAEIVINSRPIATDMNLFVDVITCYSRSTVLRTVRHVCSCDEQTAQQKAHSKMMHHKRILPDVTSWFINLVKCTTAETLLNQLNQLRKPDWWFGT